MVDRVRLLASHWVDVVSPYEDGQTPIALALVNGHASLAHVLVTAGAELPDLDPVGEVVAAAMAGDRTKLAAARPEVVAEARSTRPGLVVFAAAQGRTDVVETLLDHGWDVNARGRGDVPREGGCDTALHHAAANGDVAMTRLLLARGADPSARDERFDATPLGWAQHFSQTATIAVLRGEGDADAAD
jgi:ankyrin repeat protein